MTISQTGETLLGLCEDKAERETEYDPKAAREDALKILEDGPATGEVVVWKLKERGHVPHDDRAFGGVFLALSRRGLIRKIGISTRHRGHGTSGAVVWELVS